MEKEQKPVGCHEEKWERKCEEVEKRERKEKEREERKPLEKWVRQDAGANCPGTINSPSPFSWSFYKHLVY